MKKLVCLNFALILVIAMLPIRSADASDPEPDKLIISQIKLGGDQAPKEFVQLFNPTSSTINLTGWKLEYAKSSFSKDSCSVTSWASASVGGSASSTSLSGEILSGAISTPIERALTNESAGSLRLIDANNNVTDLVGWGDTAPCYDTKTATTPANDKSLARYIECHDNSPIDTDDNSNDFASQQTPLTTNLIMTHKSSCQDQTGTNVPNGNDSSCDGIRISEIMPNPAGSDTGNEFIEIYNPTTKALPLKNCSLQTNASSQKYSFGDESLQPGARKAFYDSTTNLTLPNSSGGTVWLLDNNDVEIDETDYPANLEDDVTWSNINNNWEASYSPSPNSENIQQQIKPCPSGQVRNVDTNRCVDVTVVTSSLVPCAPGKERNPLTNRCRNVASILGILKACSADQYRNPLTNRCKKSAVGSSVVPCRSDQIRNPETNRCRKAIAQNGLKACKEGQERNPETNRCRAIITGTSGISKITDIAAPMVKNSATWWLAGATIVGAVGYALFEWRREIATSFVGFKSKFATSSN